MAIKIAKMSNKEKILSAARENKEFIIRIPTKAISWFLYRNVAEQKGVARYIQSPEGENL